MDVATAGLIATASVGLAGTAAAFFAPTWSQTKIEQRREARELRTGTRLVADELARAAALMANSIHRLEEGKFQSSHHILTPEWDAHRTSLAAMLPEDVWDEITETYLRIFLMNRLEGAGVPFEDPPTAERVSGVLAILRESEARTVSSLVKLNEAS